MTISESTLLTPRSSEANKGARLQNRDIHLLSPYCETKYTAMNSSLNYLKYYLVDNGYRVEVHDCAFLDEEYEEIIKIIGTKEKPIIGITGYSRERFNAYKLIAKVMDLLSLDIK